MKVLAIAFVYNELPYLPQAIRYYRDQGCEVYVIDNCSNDGTWQWLQENEVPSHRFDTKEAFHLPWLQAEMIRTIHRLKPDWFIWFAPDLFHVLLDTTLKNHIITAKDLGFNQIKSECYSFKPTYRGQCDLPGPLFTKGHFNYAVKPRNVLLSSQYDESLRIGGDKIEIDHPVIMQEGIILEYGSCKPVKYQESKLERRQRAWAMGIHPNLGSHYRHGKQVDWVHDPKYLLEITSNRMIVESIRALNERLKDGKQ